MSKFVTRKWIEVNNLSTGQYSAYKKIKFKASMLRSGLCNYSDACIVVKEGIRSAGGTNVANRINKNLIFKNNSPFKSCISKINSTFIENPEDLDTIMAMYNLLEYSDSYSMTSRSLWNYYRDEINDDANVNDNNNRINNKKQLWSKPSNNNVLDAELAVPLKYLSNFLRSLDLLLINCETVKLNVT